MLTDRWFDIPDKAMSHPTQSIAKTEIEAQRYYNYVIVAGRRSYKTERFLKRLFIQSALSNENKIHILGAPTRMQAKEIFWNDIKALSPRYYIKDISESELYIKYYNGSTIQVIGLLNAERKQGSRCHLLGITEFQQCDINIYNETFEPILNDTGGIGIFEGRPLGKNHLYDFYNKQDTDKKWRSYHWVSSDILSPEQIERAKENLSEQDFNREYNASFDTESGTVYYSYGNGNVRDTYNLIYDIPIIVACDFNATEKPMSWVLGQRTIKNGRDVTTWFKEICNSYTNTETQCGILLDYLNKLPFKPELRFYGDYAGNQHKSNSAENDWQIITRFFISHGFKIEKRVKPCRSIRDSVGSTNGQLKNAAGEIKQYIVAQNCPQLAGDWLKCSWKSNNREIEENDPVRGHACRAVDYYNDYEHPVVGKPEVRAEKYR